MSRRRLDEVSRIFTFQVSVTDFEALSYLAWKRNESVSALMRGLVRERIEREDFLAFKKRDEVDSTNPQTSTSLDSSQNDRDSNETS